MRLRARLALATAGVGLPLLATLAWLDAAGRQRSAERELLGMLSARLERADERARCEADPAAWGQRPPALGAPPPPWRGEADGRGEPPGPPGPNGGPPPEGPPPMPPPGALERRPASFIAVDAALRPARGAPVALEGARIPEQVGGATSLSTLFAPSDVALLVRTPWGEGPCAFTLATGEIDRRRDAILPPHLVWALPLAVLFGAVLLSMGPVVRRIRRLTAAVHASVEGGYSAPIAAPGGDEVSELAEAFERARAEVRRQLLEKEERDLALRQFLADTTHDVAIPLTVLQGHLATLRTAHGLLPGERDALSSAMNQAHYIGALLQNLAASAKLDAAGGALRLADVELGGLATRVVDRHRPVAAELGVAIDVSVPERAVVVRGDETLLERAASNVVYNAIRHNRAGGHVAVLLTKAKDGAFCLRVLDDGPGIPPELLERVVDRGFQRDPARSRGGGGQGLGLSIAKRVADAHGMVLSLSLPEEGGLQVDLTGRRAPEEPVGRHPTRG